MTSTMRLWHSALLFILASAVAVPQATAASAAPQTPPSNYKVVWDNLANKLQCMNDNELSDMQTFIWNFDGIELENEYGASADSIIQVEQEDVQSLEKVECWASNTLGTSYAFLQFENGSVIEPSDANLTVDLTFDTDVKCKCNGACTNFKWFKNGLIMYNDTNLNNKSDEAKNKVVDINVISSSEQHLKFVKGAFF